MFSCVLAAKLAIVCLVTLPGVKEVECIDVGEYSLCVDSHYDTECLQNTAIEWNEEFKDSTHLVGMLDTLNLVCSE